MLAHEEQTEEDAPDASDDRKETTDLSGSDRSVAVVNTRDGEEGHVGVEQHGSLFCCQSLTIVDSVQRTGTNVEDEFLPFVL